MAKPAEVLENAPAPNWLKTLDGLERRFGVFRVVRFAVASGTGFLVNEGVVVLGVLLFYHSIKVPNFWNSSLTILELDAVALVVGDTVSFLINERLTVKGMGEETRKGRFHWSIRWGEFQLTSFMGNAMMVGTQLMLLAMISLSPVFGNVVGAIVSYPVTYVASMRYVWRVRPFRE